MPYINEGDISIQALLFWAVCLVDYCLLVSYLLNIFGDQITLLRKTK